MCSARDQARQGSMRRMLHARSSAADRPNCNSRSTSFYNHSMGVQKADYAGMGITASIRCSGKVATLADSSVLPFRQGT